MSYSIIIFLATCFLAYSNGANDNFKGVATLFGSRTAKYKTALWWATVTTFAGSVCSIFMAEALVKNFSGKGLVSDAVVASPIFLLSVALAAGVTVILATFKGFPISTTHGLTGALVGAGLVATGAGLNWSSLGQTFFLPLLVSPVIALCLGATVYLLAHGVRLRIGVTKEWCVCVGGVNQLIPITESGTGIFYRRALLPEMTVATQENCTQKYNGDVLGAKLDSVLGFAHFISAGCVSFARGLNDTPKIVALLLVVKALDIQTGMAAVATGMAVGGLLNARRVAITMGEKITPLNQGQGLAANMVTAFLVIFASRLGMPVSTTHVSCGSIFGVGLSTGQANRRVLAEILMAWLITLPIAALLSALTYFALAGLVRV